MNDDLNARAARLAGWVLAPFQSIEGGAAIAAIIFMSLVLWWLR